MIRRSWSRLLLTATLTLSTLCFSAISCKPDPELIPVGEARVVARLPNGNFEVTPAFILWVNDLRSENALLKLEIAKLKELIEGKQ